MAGEWEEGGGASQVESRKLKVSDALRRGRGWKHESTRIPLITAGTNPHESFRFDLTREQRFTMNRNLDADERG